MRLWRFFIFLILFSKNWSFSCFSCFMLCMIWLEVSCISLWVITMVSNSGESGDEIAAKLKRDLLPTLISGLVYWPMCDFLTFKFIPVHLQVQLGISLFYSFGHLRSYCVFSWGLLNSWAVRHDDMDPHLYQPWRYSLNLLNLCVWLASHHHCVLLHFKAMLSSSMTLLGPIVCLMLAQMHMSWYRKIKNVEDG